MDPTLYHLPHLLAAELAGIQAFARQPLLAVDPLACAHLEYRPATDDAPAGRWTASASDGMAAVEHTYGGSVADLPPVEPLHLLLTCDAIATIATIAAAHKSGTAKGKPPVLAVWIDGGGDPWLRTPGGGNVPLPKSEGAFPIDALRRTLHADPAPSMGASLGLDLSYAARLEKLWRVKGKDIAGVRTYCTSRAWILEPLGRSDGVSRRALIMPISLPDLTATTQGNPMPDLPRSSSLLVHDLAVRLRAIAAAGYPGADAAARASAEDDARRILIRIVDRSDELGLRPAAAPIATAWDLTPTAASWVGIGVGAVLACVAAMYALHGDFAGVLAAAIPGAAIAAIAPAFARAAAAAGEEV